jgi:hypothetical protein
MYTIHEMIFSNATITHAMHAHAVDTHRRAHLILSAHAMHALAVHAHAVHADVPPRYTHIMYGYIT